MMRILPRHPLQQRKDPLQNPPLCLVGPTRGMEKTSGGGFYLQVGPDGVLLGAGCFMPEREQLLAIRRHLLNVHHDYRKLLLAKKLTSAGFQPIERAMMTRPPKGFSAEEPAIDLIMQRQWGVSATLPPRNRPRPWPRPRSHPAIHPYPAPRRPPQRAADPHTQNPHLLMRIKGNQP